MKTSVINQIKTLLGMEVKLEQMKMADGVTVIEADKFEMDNEVFVVTPDEQKIPVPVGEYELEDGRILVVEVEGIIAAVNEAPMEEEVAPAEAETPEVPVEATEETATPKETEITKIVAPEIGGLKILDKIDLNQISLHI